MNDLILKVTETGQTLLRSIAPTQAISDLTRRQLNLILSVQGKLEQRKNGKWYIRPNTKGEKGGFFHIGRFTKRFSSSEK